MIKIKNTQETKEKFLCYCSKVTHQKFRSKLFSQNYKNLENLCNDLGLAKHCSACLPNIEDEFFQLKGKKEVINKIVFFSRNYSIKDKIKNFMDFISGDKLISQQGHLPMLSSKFIKTWLVISNEKPNFIKADITNFKVDLTFFNSKGKVVTKVKKIINTHNNYKLCLNKYVSNPRQNIETFYVKLNRSPTNKGFRGSTRPHFFYEAANSMSTLHLQDGARKKNYINFPLSNNKDKNMLFIINPSNKDAFIMPRLKSFLNGQSKKETEFENFVIPSKGSKILHINKSFVNSEKNLLLCESSERVKCYFIIADKKYQNISVDHI